jgi:hypothetical protein
MRFTCATVCRWWRLGAQLLGRLGELLDRNPGEVPEGAARTELLGL